MSEELNLEPIEAVKTPSQIEVFDKLANTDTGSVVKATINQAALDLTKNDEITREKMQETAKTIIDTHLATEQLDASQKYTEAKRKRSTFARKMFGVSDDISDWQQKIVDIGSAFWFCIYSVIAFFTIVPIGVFAEGLTKVFKKGWLAIVLAVLTYVSIIATPLIVGLLR